MTQTPRIVFMANSLRVGGSQSVLLQLTDIASSQGWEVIVASKGGPLEETFVRRGVRCVTLPIREGVAEPTSLLVTRPSSAIKASISLLAVHRLSRLLSGPSPTLVHASQPWPVAMAALACKRTGRSLIWHVHGTTSVEMPPQFPRLVIPQLRHTVAVSHEVGDALQPLLGGQSISVLPNPLSFDDISARPSHDSRTHLGTISTLTANKSRGIEALIDASAQIASALQPVCLNIVGDGPERPHLESRALRVAQTAPLHVVFHGEMHEPWTALSGCRVVVGVGLSALEAAIHGHRVVVAGSDGIGGVLTHTQLDRLGQTNYTGRGIAKLEVQALSRALREALAQNQESLDRTRNAVHAKHVAGARFGFSELWGRAFAADAQ